MPRSEAVQCAVCGVPGEPEDMFIDCYTDEVRCMKHVTEVQFAAGALDVERRIHELEKQVERLEATLVWIRNMPSCPPAILAKAICALGGMMPLGVEGGKRKSIGAH